MISKFLQAPKISTKHNWDAPVFPFNGVKRTGRNPLYMEKEKNVLDQAARWQKNLRLILVLTGGRSCWNGALIV